jgi:hypothetical protein
MRKVIRRHIPSPSRWVDLAVDVNASSRSTAGAPPHATPGPGREARQAVDKVEAHDAERHDHDTDDAPARHDDDRAGHVAGRRDDHAGRHHDAGRAGCAGHDDAVKRAGSS